MDTAQENLTDAASVPQPLPGFVKGWVITDIVFCSFRVLLVAFSLIGTFMVLHQGTALFYSGVCEVLTGLVIAAVGLSANIGILCRKPWAIPAAKILIAATVASILVSVWQTMLSASCHNRIQLAATIIGFLFAVGCRIVLLIFYVIAIKQASKFFASLHRQQTV